MYLDASTFQLKGINLGGSGAFSSLLGGERTQLTASQTCLPGHWRLLSDRAATRTRLSCLLTTLARLRGPGPKGRKGETGPLITPGGQDGACPVPGRPGVHHTTYAAGPAPQTSPSREEPKAMKAPHSWNSHAWGPRCSERVSGSHERPSCRTAWCRSGSSVRISPKTARCGKAYELWGRHPHKGRPASCTCLRGLASGCHRIGDSECFRDSNLRFEVCGDPRFQAFIGTVYNWCLLEFPDCILTVYRCKSQKTPFFQPDRALRRREQVL